MFHSITSVLVSRFLLDLQAVKRKTQHQSSLGSMSSSIIFERIMGSIDAELQPGDLQILSGGNIADREEENFSDGHRQGRVDPVLSVSIESTEIAMSA